MSSVAIIGAGISGLATAYFLKQQHPNVDLKVFEKETNVGGNIRATQRDGFTFDWSANGFLTNVPETLELAHSLGLERELLPASDNAKYRYLFKNNALQSFPASPPAFLTTNLLSPLAKLRAASEYFRGKTNAQEESVYAFIARHFGSDVANTFAEPAVVGITSGNAKELSVDALFPRFRKLEQDHGSLIKGLIALQKQAKQKQAKGSGSRLTSFKAGGMQKLTDALGAALSPNLRKGVEVVRLTKLEQGYAVALNSGETFQADNVVLATPAFVSAKLLASLVPEAATLLSSIPYADVVVFGLGYNRIDVPHDLKGFGFLTARNENVRVLGVLWSSSIFPDQAPQGHVMLRVICGGAVDPEFINLTDEERLGFVQRDLRITMGITAKPVFMEQIIWKQGIPQYLIGHSKKIEGVLDSVRGLEGVYLTGNAFHGVGVNDCVREAKKVAATIAEG